MEFHVLEVLGWRTSVLTPHHFLDRLLATLGLPALLISQPQAYASVRLHAQHIITQTLLGRLAAKAFS